MFENTQFVTARRICTIAENNSVKKRHLKRLKENLRTYGYPEKLLKLEYKKTLQIPQKELDRPIVIENSNNLTFINTFNPNNLKIFDLVKSGANTLAENNVNGCKSMKLIYANRQTSESKRLLTNSLFTNWYIKMLRRQVPMLPTTFTWKFLNFLKH